MKTLYNPDSEDVKFTYSAQEYTLNGDSETELEDAVAEHAIKLLAHWGVVLLPEGEEAQELAKQEAEKYYNNTMKLWAIEEVKAYGARIKPFDGTGYTPKPTTDEAFALDWLKRNS